MPRVLDLRAKCRPLVVFTDAALEGGVATWGFALIDPASGRREVAGGCIPSQLVDLWHLDTSDQVISPAEAFAMVLARTYVASFAKGRRTFFFRRQRGSTILYDSG